MRRYLIVAHKTLGGDHLIDHVRALRKEGPCRFLLLVPVQHPSSHVWTEGEVKAAARRKLQEGLDRFHDEGIIADGEIGDANPVFAVATVVRREGPAPSPGSSSRRCHPARRGGSTWMCPPAWAETTRGSRSPTSSLTGSWPTDRPRWNHLLTWPCGADPPRVVTTGSQLWHHRGADGVGKIRRLPLPRAGEPMSRPSELGPEGRDIIPLVRPSSSRPPLGAS